MAGKVNLIATIRSKDGHSHEVLELLNRYGQHVLASDGTERFEVYRDREDQHTMIVIERYRDEAAFKAHIADPENGAVNLRLAQLTVGGSTLRFLME